MSSAITLSRLTLGVAATTATTASGAIVVFDVNPDTVIRHPSSFLAVDDASVIHFSNINLSSGAFAQSSSGTFSEFLTGYGSSTFSVGTLIFPNYGPFWFAGSPDGLTSFMNGFLPADLAVNTGSGGTWNNSQALNAYDLPSGVSYVGLRLVNGADFNYGWIEFTDYAGGPDKLVTRFAFNDVAGQSILTGQTTAIPEASTLGLVGGLFGLVAAAHVRRRKLKKAAASDKFLALAAGEKLN